MDVGILGGTFDPPHKGHLELARIVLSSGEVEQVWFVPCFAHRLGKQPASFADRLAMCRLLVADEVSMCVSDIEQELEHPGYTLELLHALAARYPSHGLRLVAGTDIYHEREKWHRYDEVASLAPPIYVERLGSPPIPLPMLPPPPEISSSRIRQEIENGISTCVDVPQEVMDYIVSRGLYRRSVSR